MKPRLYSLLFAVVGTLVPGVFPPRTVSAADRKIDTNVVYPAAALIQNGGRVLNVQNPPSGVTAASGNGKTDDTAALQSAYTYIKNQNAANSSASYIIYLPNGTYRVTSTIIYSGAAASNPQMHNVRFVGETRGSTTIQLDSNLAGFQSASSPTPVLDFQHPLDAFNNTATQNLCENLTVNTGAGNPGAVGIDFMGANAARMSNVTVASADGSGYAGIWLRLGSIQAYLKDITISGFNYGIDCKEEHENDTAWEHISINNPTIAAIYMEGGGLSMRDLDLNQSELHVPAVQFTGTASDCWLLDSHLNGGNASYPAVVITNSMQEFFMRNVTLSGYTVAVQNQGTNAVSGPFISEYIAQYVNNPVTTLFTVADQHSFAEQVQDTPTVAWQTNTTSNWFNVNGYGAVGNGTTDDSAAIQAAFTAAGNTAQSVVYFPSLSYKISKAITIPAAVTRADFMFSNITGGSFSVNVASSNPLLVVGKINSSITINAMRPVIAELCGGNVSNQQTGAVNTYLESCTGYGSGSQVCTANQNVWARCINDELTSGNDIECNGGTLWIMGYKTENKACISVLCQNGGYTEVLGGYVNCTSSPTTPAMLENSDANMCYTGYTSFTGTFSTVISETQGSTTASDTASAFPARGDTSYSNDFFVPLYIGGARPNSLGMFKANQDIGTVGATGSVSTYGSLTYPTGTAANTFFIDGSGTDITGTADSFHFVSASVTGNVTLVAKVDSIDDTNQYAKAGVMLRDSTDPAAPFVAVLMEVSAGAIMESRSASGASAVVTTKTSLRLPYWVKLVQNSASSFTGYTSPDGTTWTIINTVTANLPDGQLAGLAMTSHVPGTVGRAILEGVSLTTAP